jgi:hypothetical protein
MDVVASAVTSGVRQVLSVLVVFTLLGVTLWALRRGYKPGILCALGRWTNRFPSLGAPSARRVSANRRSLERMEKLVLTPQHTLHLIRVQGRDVVVATHPHGCTTIAWNTSFPACDDEAGT